MSSKKKEGSSKEKGETSPSSSHKSSPKHSKTSKSLDSSPSDKTVPNYLKPTLSSSLSSAADTIKLQVKRAVSHTDNALKSNLARRRSFDKPPSPTRSSKTRGVSPTPPFRASSTGKTGGGKATTTTSPKADRGSKSKDHHHAWKQPSLYARAVGTLKKSVGKSHKTETGTTPSKKASNHDDQDSPKGEAEEHKAIHDSSEEKEHEDHGEIDEVEHDHKPDHSKADASDDDHDGKVESPTIIDERDASIDKAESLTVCEDSDGSDSKVDSPTLLGQIADAAPGPAKVESPVKSEAGESQHEGNDIVCVDSPTASEEHDHASLGEIVFTEEMKEHSENVIDNTIHPNEEAKAEAEEEAKSEVEDEEGSATKEAEGKKDVGLSSNNVIEEMTREQRLNKVKAIAGAFETVIQVHKK